MRPDKFLDLVTKSLDLATKFLDFGTKKLGETKLDNCELKKFSKSMRKCQKRANFFL